MKNITKMVAAGNWIKVCEDGHAYTVRLTENTKVTVTLDPAPRAARLYVEAYGAFDVKNVYAGAKGKTIVIPTALLKASPVVVEAPVAMSAAVSESDIV
jgi:hypothetical protein